VHREQGRRAVDDGGINDLTCAGLFTFQKCSAYPERDQESATSEITHQVRWGLRWAFGLSEHVERSGSRDVPDVVARSTSKGSGLAPTCHPGIDQARIARMTDVGTESETLGYAGPEAFEQDICDLDQLKQCVTASRMLEIQQH
jgi:hypothetical protein